MKRFPICVTLLCISVFQIKTCLCQNNRYRPKIAEFSYQFLNGYYTSAHSERFGNAATETERDHLLKLKLGIPLVLQDQHTFGIQLKYYRHFFNLDEDFQINNDLLNHLRGRQFNNVGFRFLYQYKIDKTKSLSVVGGVEIHSDQIELTNETGKYFLSTGYKKQLSPNSSIGFGATASYSLGRFSFFPVLSYTQKLSPDWTLDLMLPKSVSLRYEINPKTYLIGSTELVGWDYNLTRPLPNLDQNFTLNKLDLEFRLKLEREIHDWLWCGVDLGFNKNLRYFLTNPGERYRDALANIYADNTSFLKLSVFLVPPRKLFRK